MPSPAQALSRVAGRRALLVGDLILDVYIYGQTARVSREAPVLVVRREGTERRLGGAANTAANLTALGVHTDVLSIVGADDGAKHIKTLLAEMGAHTSGIIEGAGATAVKTRILAGAVGTSRQQVLRLDDEPDAVGTAELCGRLAEQLEAHAADADVVVLSDYGMGVVDAQVIEAARRVVKKGIPVCVDSRYRLGEFTGLTVVTPNVPEAEGQLDFFIDSQNAAERAGVRLMEKLQGQMVLLTQGRGGMTLFERGEQSKHVAIAGKGEVTDVTGAGDTVIATFAAALAGGLGAENGMRLANCAAGVVVNKVGAATASPEEIGAWAERWGVELLPWEK